MHKGFLAAALAVGVIVSVTTGREAFAAHPLITDDTGTQGKGKIQIELTGEYGRDKDAGVTTNSFEVPTAPVLSIGVAETVDLVLSSTYQIIETEEEGASSTTRGASDTSIELKWRFYEKDGLSFAVKPGVSLPTGDANKGLGNGKASYGAFFISTKEMEPWAVYFNLGYIRNEYELQADKEANRKDIWHVSLASQVEVVKNLNIVANIGMETNSDKTSNTDPAFILGGIIYTIAEAFDIDLGIKAGLNKSETDIAYLAGMAVRF
jgi:hypothetical protein